MKDEENLCQNYTHKMECSENQEGISRSQERVEEADQTGMDSRVKRLNGGDEWMKPPTYHIYNGI